MPACDFVFCQSEVLSLALCISVFGMCVSEHSLFHCIVPAIRLRSDAWQQVFLSAETSYQPLKVAISNDLFPRKSGLSEVWIKVSFISDACDSKDNTTVP